MSNDFFTNSLFKEINFTIPVFKNELGYAMKIKIEKVNINEFHFYIHFLNSKNETVSLNHLDKGYILFFLTAYKAFISNIRYRRSKNILSKIKSDLLSANKMLKNKEFSIFTFLSTLNLPLVSFNKIYTFDESDGSCLGKTLVVGGNVVNINYNNYSDTQIWYVSALNLKLILKALMIENEYSLQIPERLLSYFRNIISLGIVILNIWLFFLVKCDSFFLVNCDPFLPWDFVWFGISIIGVPLSRWLFKGVFYYIIEKNISALFSTDRRASKKEKRQP
jgi:hypothetical protein